MNSLFRKKVNSVVGLDIGTKFVKAVCLDISGAKASVLGYSSEPIFGNAFSERDVQDFEAISKAIRKVSKTIKSKSKDAVIAVAGSNVISKKVHMEPNQSDHEMEMQIELEADSLIPYPLEEVYLDFAQIGKSDTHPDKVEVLLSTAHRDLIDKRITLVREANLEPVIVDIETNALADSLLQFCHAEHDQTQVVVNIGASLMQICVLDKNEVTYIKEHTFGTNSYIQDLSLIHAIDIQEIERQIADGTAPEAWFKETLATFVGNLQQQIQRALQMFVSTTHSPMPSHIYLSGGAANLPNIGQELSNDMNMRVELFNPFDEITTENEDLRAKLNEVGPQYAIAAGLASRRLNQWQE